MNKFIDHWKTALQNKKSMHYFMDQLENPKKSTFFFNEYFHDQLLSSKKIIDLGGGWNCHSISCNTISKC